SHAVIATHARYALSRSVRAPPDREVSDVLIRSLHWAALIPESAWHESALWQTPPATSGPPPPLQPPIATASSTAARDRVFLTVHWIRMAWNALSQAPGSLRARKCGRPGGLIRCHPAEPPSPSPSSTN